MRAGGSLFIIHYINEHQIIHFHYVHDWFDLIEPFMDEVIRRFLAKRPKVSTINERYGQIQIHRVHFTSIFAVVHLRFYNMKR